MLMSNIVSKRRLVPPNFRRWKLIRCVFIILWIFRPLSDHCTTGACAKNDEAPRKNPFTHNQTTFDSHSSWIIFIYSFHYLHNIELHAFIVDKLETSAATEYKILFMFYYYICKYVFFQSDFLLHLLYWINDKNILYL